MASPPTETYPSAPHPSDIPGRTDEYKTFLKTWGAQARGGPGVFQGHVNCLIQAELRAVGQDVVAYAEAMFEKMRPQWRAIDRLTADLIRFLGSHDCVAAGHVGDGCPDGAALLARLAKARAVLELPPIDAPEGGPS